MRRKALFMQLRGEATHTKWGIPKDKNITTFEWGVNEQWVFSGNRYVYIEDGYVTAVQEWE